MQMRKSRAMILPALAMAVATVFFAPGAMASESTAPAPHAAASSPIPSSSSATVNLRPTGTASNAVDPECKLFFMNQQGKPGGLAHISSFLFHHHDIRAVKINAKVECRRVVMNLFMQVTLWKTGLIVPHKVAGPNPPATAAKGNQLKDQNIWKECKNRTSTTYYGTSYASVWFQGVQYTGSLQSGNATLDCGT
ncbi:MAG TPA: hypothetical protein VF070_14375 [Streptosporangiaceae bacterium]